ncbi:MAG: helix-hairpin-helix domain-containing protein [candidate division KSB1 bacterium]|nr:helix-hairpin-helix domain-containing protein [candidate division KSB1 bacterium]
MIRKIFVFLAWIAVAGYCQVPADDLERLAESDETVDDNSLFEQLDQLARRPIDLNRATTQELAELPIPSVVSAKILNYRIKHGPFQSIEDLLKIRGLSAYLPQIQPFIVIEPPAAKIHASGRHRLRNKTAKSSDQFFLASQVYNRLRVEWKKTACGILIEKDAGEAAFDDFVTGHIISEPVTGMRIILGDYTVEAGRGLVFGGPFSLPLGTDPMTPAKLKRTGAFPFLSANENFPFRGAALQFHRGPLLLCVFGSDKRRDASIEEGQVVSLPEDGLHRTPAELRRRKALRECSEGMALLYNPFQNLRLGAATLQNRFFAPFADEEYGKPRKFTGNKNRLGSLFGEFILEDVALFGEAAWCMAGGTAWTFGALGNGADYDWILIRRRYSPDFFSFYASAFGEPKANNQEGFYLGGEYRLSPVLQASFYYDQAKKMSVFQPSGAIGDVLMIGLQAKFSKMTVRSRLKLRKRSENVKTLDKFGNLVSAEAEEQRGTWRTEMEVRPHRFITVRNAVELSFASRATRRLGDGSLLSCRLQMNMRSLRMSVGSSFFDASNYALRFYQPESDFPGALPLVMLYGQGVRSYAVLAAKIFALTLSAKYEQTVYRYRPAGGNDDNRRISLQMDWQW